jgi:hypothetical protein
MSNKILVNGKYTLWALMFIYNHKQNTTMNAWFNGLKTIENTLPSVHTRFVKMIQMDMVVTLKNICILIFK